jgi:hypothetical protein
MIEKTVDAILERPVEIEVIFEHRKFWQPRRKVWMVKPTHLGTYFEICKVLGDMNISKEDLEKTSFDLGVEFGRKYGEKIIELLALAIHNKPGKPPKSIRRILRDNLNSKQLLSMMQLVVGLIDVTPFTTTIILSSGMSLLKSPEIIAGPIPGESSED